MRATKKYYTGKKKKKTVAQELLQTQSASPIRGTICIAGLVEVIWPYNVYILKFIVICNQEKGEVNLKIAVILGQIHMKTYLTTDYCHGFGHTDVKSQPKVHNSYVQIRVWLDHGLDKEVQFFCYQVSRRA